MYPEPSPATGAAAAGPRTAAAPQISVVVAHLNQPEALRILLASLFAQDFGRQDFGGQDSGGQDFGGQDFDIGDVEVIVVDNGSRVLPHAVIADFPGVRLAEEATPGPGPARNRGVALARAPLLAFIDSDCVAAPGWLATIRARFAADPGLQVAGGRIALLTRIPGDPTPVEAYECVYAFDQRDFIERKGFSVTANLAMRRAAFDAVGPFAGIEIAEDMDWGERATAMGIRTRYLPDMLIAHPARHSLAEMQAKWDRNISHHYRVRARGAAGKARWTLAALAMCGLPFAQIPHILRSDRIAGAGNRLRAFRGLAAVQFYRCRRMLAVMAAPAGNAGNLDWNRK